MNDRNFDRFAFLLIDNVVELTFHKYAEDHASENMMWGSLSPPNAPQTVKDGLGQYFDRKTKAMCKLDLIDDALRDSILSLHKFRNTAHHQGLRHEGILHSLALFYFECCCDVLLRYKLTGWGWGNENISHRARKYLGNFHPGNPHDALKAAYNRLSEVASSMGGSLVADLTADLTTIVDELDGWIDFLATDNPRAINRDDAIIDAQAWPFSFSDEAKEFAKGHGCKARQEWPVDCEWIKKTYKWPVSSDPIESWRSRIQSISAERDKHIALKKYRDFLAQTESIRSQIEAAAQQLDAHIQQMTDEARGK